MKEIKNESEIIEETNYELEAIEENKAVPDVIE